MSTADYTVLSVILCEEIRPEQGGKQTLLGVFDDELLVGEMPAAVTKLSFRVAVKAGKTPLTSFEVRVTSKVSGTKIFEVARNLDKPGRPKHGSALGFSISPAFLPDEGQYA